MKKTSGYQAVLAASFVSRMTRCALRADDRHLAVQGGAEALESINALFIDNIMSFTVREGRDLLINGINIQLDTTNVKKFFLRLRHKGVLKVTIRRGVRPEEILGFFEDVASSRGFFHSYVDVAVIRGKEYDDQSKIEVRKPHGDVYEVKKMFRETTSARNIDMTDAGRVVGRLISNIRRKKNILDLIAPVQAGDDRLFLHSLNVARLSVYQAEGLGFGNTLLHKVGFAALFHDIGKMLLPRDVVDRQDSLGEKGWSIMKKHPVCGAALLSSIKKMPEIAAIVAFEHHMKYDGTGYPSTKGRSRKQHIISQIVALSDFYCALKEEAPHRKPLDGASVLELLAKTSGRELNPLLVDSFAQSFHSGAPAY
jgi:putative nucleotidyltransferase with HDIG domain